MKNMFVTKKIGNKTITFEVEGKNLHELVMEAKELDFENIPECGCCHSKDLYLDARIVPNQGFKYVEVKCQSCGAALVFGTKKDNPNTFYPRHREENGKRIPDWRPHKKETEDTQTSGAPF